MALNHEDFKDLSDALRTLRFMMATALTAPILDGKNKQAAKHMGRLAELNEKLDKEVKNGQKTT